MKTKREAQKSNTSAKALLQSLKTGAEEESGSPIALTKAHSGTCCDPASPAQKVCLMAFTLPCKRTQRSAWVNQSSRPAKLSPKQTFQRSLELVEGPRTRRASYLLTASPPLARKRGSALWQSRAAARRKTPRNWSHSPSSCAHGRPDHRDLPREGKRRDREGTFP